MLALGGPWDLIVGHSLGGAVAVDALDREPILSSRLVLIDPVLALSDADWAAVARTHLEEVRRPPSASVFARSNPRWHPRDAQLKAQAVRQTSTSVIQRTLEDNRPWEFRPQASRLSCETVILAGDAAAGGLLSAALTRNLSTSNPTLVVRTVQGAGHSIHRERPAVVVHAIDELIARTLARPTPNPYEVETGGLREVS
jgi:pimeloyl-ACP methyl ester carboxylesterase